MKDLSEYLNISIHDVISNAKIKDTAFEDRLWNKKKRTSINDYREYYSENIHYLERQDYYNLNHIQILSEFKKLNIGANILDYGCGTATLSFNAKTKRNDLNIFLADIPEAITKNYAKWRFDKYKLDYTWIDIPKNEKLLCKSKFDLIRCHDVFEHSFYPLIVIKFFFDHLKDEGLLSFDYLEIQKVHKETTIESQQYRKEFFDFINLNFKYIYSFKNKYVVKKK